MPKIQVTPFFRFCRVKVVKQEVDTVQNFVTITVRPDERYIPVCRTCQRKVKQIHSYHCRMIRDLNVFDAKSFISVAYRRLRCPHCGTVVEELPLMNPSERVSRRLTTYVLGLCKYMTITDIAEHLDLDWKTVKEIHKRFLQEKFSHEERGSPKILVIDEVSIKRRHKYLTIIADWESGRILGVGKGRSYETLRRFFLSLSEPQRHSIEAVAMDGCAEK